MDARLGGQGGRSMTTKNIRVKLENGAEARPVALLVQEASKYDSVIYIQAGGRRVNAKSIMGLFTFEPNTCLDLIIHSDNYKDYLTRIDKFLVD